MKNGNRAILDQSTRGRTLRVFEGASGDVRYLGEFGLDPAEPWYEELSHESGGSRKRSVIMFRLIPTRDFYHEGKRRNREDVDSELQQPYREANETIQIELVRPAEPNPDKVGEGRRRHAKIQNRLAATVRANGFEPLSPGFGDPPFDVGWWKNDTFVVAEIKSITEANEVGQLRLGLGQVLDYAYQIQMSGRSTRPVLAVESKPSDERWLALCDNHGVSIVWPGIFDALFRDREQ